MQSDMNNVEQIMKVKGRFHFTKPTSQPPQCLHETAAPSPVDTRGPRAMEILPSTPATKVKAGWKWLCFKMTS